MTTTEITPKITANDIQSKTLKRPDNVLDSIRKVLVAKNWCIQNRYRMLEEVKGYQVCYDESDYEINEAMLAQKDVRQYYDTKYQLKPMGYVVGIS